MATAKDAAEAEASEFASVMAELESDQGDDNAESDTPEADSVESDPEANEELEETEDPELETAAPADVEAFRGELSELLDSGDLKGLADKLGVDPSIFKLNNKQFKASRLAETNARRSKAEAEQALATASERAARAEQLQALAEETYGPVAAGSAGYRAGDYSQTRAAIELLCQDKFENVVANLARAAKGLDPGQVEVLKLRRELAERDRKANETAAQAAAAAEEAEQVGKISTALAKTPLAAVPGADREIWALVKASKHPTLNKYTKTVKDAYAEVKAAHAARAAAFTAAGSKPRAAKPPETRRPLAGTRPASAPARKLSPQEEFQRELALAARDTETQARKNRRGK